MAEPIGGGEAGALRRVPRAARRGARPSFPPPPRHPLGVALGEAKAGSGGAEGERRVRP